MESNELLASLAKMEASLKEVESARMQVESTVNASAELQKKVGGYISAVKALCDKLQSWESDLKERESSISHEYEDAISRINSTCAEIISSFGNEAEKTSANFKTQIEPVIEKFAEQNSKLKDRVADLVALREQIKEATGEIARVKSALNEILTELKDSQDAQDATLNELKQGISGLSLQMQNDSGAVLQAITNSENTLSNVLNQTNGKVDSVSSKADTLVDNISSLDKVCQKNNTLLQSSWNSIISAINQTKEDVTDTLQGLKAEVLKSSIINRWIIVGGIVILAILQFVLK